MGFQRSDVGMGEGFHIRWFIIALGSSWAGRWMSAGHELGRFETCVAQSFPSVSFGAKIFGLQIFGSIIFCLWFWLPVASLYVRIIAWLGRG